jgi:hypothetical protein
MDGHDDHHSSHPAAGAILVLIIAAIYAVIFKLVDGGWTGPVVLAAVLLGAFGLVQVLVADRD